MKADGYNQFPIRTDIEILPADDPKQKKLGIICFERPWVSAVNPKCLASLKIRKTRLSDNER